MTREYSCLRASYMWDYKRETRTLEDMVEDLITDGRTTSQIRAVVNCTRWVGREREAVEKAKDIKRGLRKFLRKK